MQKLKNSRWVSLAVIVGIIVIVQIIGNLATMPEIQTWYAGLNQPAWTPPNWVFGPVWTLLYIMIALSGWILWENTAGNFTQRLQQPALRYYAIQLLLNFLWSPLFFKFHLVEIALIDILAMIIFVALTIKYSLLVDRRAAYLLMPYLIWICYASTLNAGVLYLN